MSELLPLWLRSLLPDWVENFLPIVGLLIVVAIVIARLPKIDLGHSDKFRRRRVANWLPLGLTYAFLYMGRYNLTVAKTALGHLMTKEDFGTIFFWGTIVYGVSFVINGPVADKLGGRKTILIAAVGAGAMNLAMGLSLHAGLSTHLVSVFSVLYALNMYFQSFGAVSIVKVNASWFHVRERGVFGGIFGILISLGIYFAFDWGRIITKNLPVYWVFVVPTIILSVFAVIDFFLVRDTPGDAGLEDFDTADASSGDDGPRLGVIQVAKKMLANPIIVTIAAIEFCSGYLRNSIMHWYLIFAKQTGVDGGFVAKNWGLLLCAAGILGGVFAGILSDRVFQSRRGPSAGILYGVMLLGSVVMLGILGSPWLGALVLLMSLSIIGVHGMLSGTASMDFGGRKNVGVAVGMIDGMVYLGTALEAIVLGHVLPTGEAQAVASNWWTWPVVMIPIALVGFVLTLRIWKAKPKPSSTPKAPTDGQPAAAA